MDETHVRLPSEIATQLQLSPSTLRRWSNEFADYLSDSAGRPEAAPSGGRAHRRYTDLDLETLMTIKGLLAEGLTYIQVARRLEILRLRRAAAEEAEEGDEPQLTVLGPSYQEPRAIAPAVSVLADTLHTVADGQQLLLGSQQANRDMLTVLLQDNFSLKEENAKLRDRMLEMERDLSEIRRQESRHKELLEARLNKLETQKALRKVDQAPSEDRPGCMTRFRAWFR
jgi:DNA-binding transcriptional MerR regulator